MSDFALPRGLAAKGRLYKKIFRAVLCAALCACALPACAARYGGYYGGSGERITSFDVAATVNEDASLTVSETLELVSAGVGIAHGIVREIPVRYNAENGRSVRVGLEVLSTSVDGRELPWKEYDEGRSHCIRIGDASRVLSNGSHTLTLVYRTTKQLGFFEGYDELYWNVTGNDWEFPIDSASFSLTLPGLGLGEGFSAVEWYTGVYGSTAQSGAQLDGANSVYTTRMLSPGEGLTVVYVWPKGIVAEPQASFYDRALDFVCDNADAVCGVLTLAGAAIGALLLAVGYSRARGRPSPVVIPLFHAPEGMTPSLARYVMTGRVGTKSLGAELIAMAVAGFLRIKGNKKDGYALEKRGADPTEPPYARLDELFFSVGNEVRLGRDKAELLRNARLCVEAETEMRAGKLTDDRRGIVRLAYGVMLASAGASAVFAVSTGFASDESAFSSVLLAFLSLICVLNLSRKDIGKERGAVKSAVAALGPLLPVLVFLVLTGTALQKPVLSGAYALLALAGLPLKKKLLFLTEDGAKLRAQAEGLEMFINAAEKDRLEMLNPPDDTPALFEELLPYAVALDCAKTWADRFAKTLESAGYEPAWCDAPAGGFVRAGVLASQLGSFTGALSAASSVSAPSALPSSRSGYSGGGFGGGSSGGGGGGGGGHGW